MKPRTVQILSISFFAALLLWGLYTLLCYIGMPIHAAVLLTDSANQMVNTACGSGTDHLLCRGAYSFFPFLLHTVGRAQPFLWYVVISLIVYALFLAWRWFVDSRLTFAITWKPWKMYALFLGALWLLFTVLSYGSADGRPTRTFFEPLPQIYSVSPQGLQALVDDYHSLDSRGCLAQQPGDASGARVYTLREWCVQSSFVTRVMTQVAFVTIVLFEFLILGSAILGLLRLRFDRLMVQALVAVTLGACGWIMLLWSGAVFGIYTATFGWVLAVLVPILCYADVIRWLKHFFRHEWRVEYRWHDLSLLLGWFLLSYIALNFLTVVRPFPIGWDDLGSYLNRPRLLVSYGHFIFSMTTFEWGYITSLGFLLFGYQSIFGATASMMANWLAGLLALLSVFVFTNSYLGRRTGLIATLLYYTLPLVGHFSFADMKIDNAVFLMGAVATLLLFLPLFPRETDPDDAADALPPEKEKDRWKYFLLAGLFGGIAFAIKVTAIMVLMPMGAILLGTMLGWPAFVGGCFLAFFVYSEIGGFDITTIAQRVGGGLSATELLVPVFVIGCLLLGLAFVSYALWRNRARAKMLGLSIGVFVAGFAIAIVPWVEHNNILSGHIIPRLELAAPDTLTPAIVIQGPKPSDSLRQVRVLPKDLTVNPALPACRATGSTEELDRYWGFSRGWSHYLTLPWRTVMNADSGGYYVTTIPALLLFPLLLLLPYFWTRKARWLRWMFVGTLFMVFEWIILANGVPWYGIGIFLGIVLGLEVMTARAPDLLGKWVAGIFLTLSLLLALNMRIWQFEQTRNIFEYSLGKVSADVLKQLTIPYYDGITGIVVKRHDSMPDRPYLYRVGTFIPYFIPKNLEIIGINDPQLDNFNCLYAERNGALTLQRLKALGFNSIIFDTNTATIEHDMAGSLHKKVQAFQDFVNDPALKLEVVISDTNAGVAFIQIP